MVLLKSRRFWLAVVDAVVSLVLLAVGIQWPQYAEAARKLIDVLLPLVILLITALTIDDTLRALFEFKLRERGRMK